MSRIHLSFLAPGKNSGYKNTVTDIYYKGMNVGYIIEDKDMFPALALCCTLTTFLSKQVSFRN